MKQYLLTISENKNDCVMSYVINEKDMPVGTTIENIIEKIVASIIVGSSDKPETTYLVNDRFWVIQFDDYHYDICLQEAADFILDVFGDLSKPIKDRAKFYSLLKNDCTGLTDDKFIAFQDELKQTAGIQSLGGQYNFK